jgi:hypothetical protein
MKAFVAILSLLFSVSAFAKIDFSQGQTIDKVEVDGQSSKYSGTVAITKGDDESSIIELKLAGPFHCPAGKMCIQVMDAFTLSAKLVATTDNCGSIIYTALTDGTPYDGSRVEITVQDNSGRMCRDMRRGLIEVTAKESYLRTQYEKNYFAVQTYMHDSKNFNLSKGIVVDEVTLKGDEAGGRGGFVKVNSKKREVLISYSFASCDDGGACQPMFQLKELKLKLMSVKNDGCGSVVYKAQTAGIIPGADYSEVTITDNTKRLCEDVIQGRLVVDGSTRYPYPGREGVEFKLLKK